MIQLAELRSRCTALAEQFNSLWGRLDLPSREARLEEIEQIISSPDAWNDQEKLTPVLKEKSRLEAEVERYRALRTSYEEMQEGLGFVSEGEEDALETLNEQADELEKLLTQTEMTVLLSGEADHMDALLDIHPGAGGTEA
ncbi:MAG: PCRF domain-containing protein, partial [Mailhella sp.]|nr:PCRF domain-containing protein [Mailhella sp.]